MPLILHPVTAGLIDGLAESELRPWARAVLWKLSGAGEMRGEDDAEFEAHSAEVEDWLGGVMELSGPLPTEVALAQLDGVGSVVRNEVSRELAVLARIAELAPKVKATDVLVVGPRREVDVSLTDGSQRRALEVFTAEFEGLLRLAASRIAASPDDGAS